MSRSISQQKLRRLGKRAVRVFKRHQGTASNLTAFDVRLESAVQRYEALHDRLEVMTFQRATEVAQGNLHVTRLYRTVTCWLAPLSRDIPGFDTTRFRSRVTVPDDVTTDAERLLELVRERTERPGSLPYGEKLITELTVALQAAQEEWEHTQQCLAADQQLRTDLREAGEVLKAELIPFRKAVRAALGWTHRDYQTLRTTRAAASEAEDLETAEDSSNEVPTQAVPTPAAPVVVALTNGVPGLAL